jgi:hypothetical protein
MIILISKATSVFKIEYCNEKILRYFTQTALYLICKQVARQSLLLSQFGILKIAHFTGNSNSEPSNKSHSDNFILIHNRKTPQLDSWPVTSDIQFSFMITCLTI